MKTQVEPNSIGPIGPISPIRPIGFISTPFKDRYDAPRQPGVDPPEIGIITLNAGENFEQALEDLDGFEKIWLIYCFHRNQNWKPKVLPPRGTEIKRGVFATRSPHRPNPIGLSLVDLIEVKGLTLKVAGVDLLDGTPILDIKPYLPSIEAFPQARTGWLNPQQTFEVRWSDLAKQQTDWLREKHAVDLSPHVNKVLAVSPEPHQYRRIKQIEPGIRQLAIRSWRILFTVNEEVVYVLEVQSGYSALELANGDKSTLHDGDAHKAFHKNWPPK
jgi:tRNA-Thr(GGU) m(6)t(6)A37 methyltransferase TsaA